MPFPGINQVYDQPAASPPLSLSLGLWQRLRCCWLGSRGGSTLYNCEALIAQAPLGLFRRGGPTDDSLLPASPARNECHVQASNAQAKLATRAAGGLSFPFSLSFSPHLSLPLPLSLSLSLSASLLLSTVL